MKRTLCDLILLTVSDNAWLVIDGHESGVAEEAFLGNVILSFFLSPINISQKSDMICGFVIDRGVVLWYSDKMTHQDYG